VVHSQDKSCSMPSMIPRTKSKAKSVFALFILSNMS